MQLTNSPQLNQVDTEPENGWSARSRITRQKLITTASKLMVQKGIRSVSVAAVAREAGITRPGAYYHFKSRDELLDAVRAETDHLLVRTVTGSMKDEFIYSQAAELAAEDEDTIFLRIQRLLDQGSRDIIIASRKRGFERLKREGRLQAGVDAHMAAIISSATIIAAYLAVSQAKQEKRRHQLAKVFGKTIYEHIFHGVLKFETFKDWPELPKYSNASNDLNKSKPKPARQTSDARRAKAIETRNLLMKATMRLMAEVGEEAVSISEVARRAGVTRPGAYYHFKKKEDLITAVEAMLDRELLHTIDKSFTEREFYDNSDDLSTEDLSLLKIRVQRMLKSGAENDPLINYYRKLFHWHQKHGHTKDNIDPDMAAIITATVSLIGILLTVSEANTIEARTRLAKRFRKTYSSFVFTGIIDPTVENNWPPPPSAD